MATATLTIPKHELPQRIAQSTRRRTTAHLVPKHRQRMVLNVAARKYNFLMELLSNFNFVQVEESDGKNVHCEQDTDKELEVRLLNDFLEEENIATPTRRDIAFFGRIAKNVAKDVALIEADKLEVRPLKDFLNEL